MNAIKKTSIIIGTICIIILFSITSTATLNVSLSDQGTNVKIKSTGALLTLGNLTVWVFDSLTGGTMIYNETFVSAIANGSWNVMLGENASNPLSLEFGRQYYKDYTIGTEDVDFTNLTGGTAERQFFFSPLGDISGEDVNSAANLTVATLNATNNLTVGTGPVFLGSSSLGIGTMTPQKTVEILNAGLIFNMSANDNFVVDGAANLRNITQGVMRFVHKPQTTGTRPVTFSIDDNGFGDTKAIVIDYEANLSSGEVTHMVDINIDQSRSTGGDIHGIHISSAGSGNVTIEAIHVLPTMDVLRHDSGSSIGAEAAFIFNASTSTFTNTTTAFNSSTNNVTIFANNDDIVYLGNARQFSQAVFTFDRTSSKSISPTFEFSNGSNTWVGFTPTDGTNGMQFDGTISWHNDSLTGWTTDTVNGTANKHWIRITRTRPGSITPPIENLVLTSTTSLFFWDQNGDIRVRNATITSLPTAPPNGTTGRAVCVDGVGNLWVDNDGTVDCT